MLQYVVRQAIDALDYFVRMHGRGVDIFQYYFLVAISISRRHVDESLLTFNLLVYSIWLIVNTLYVDG